MLNKNVCRSDAVVVVEVLTKEHGSKYYFQRHVLQATRWMKYCQQVGEMIQQ